jgi:hypothetical protein
VFDPPGLLSDNIVVVNLSAIGRVKVGRDGTGGMISSCDTSEESCLLRDFVFILNMNLLRLDDSET